MKITYVPVAAIPDGFTSVPASVSGDVIIISGILYDFSPLPEGGSISIGEPFLGDVKRSNGKVEVTLLYFYDDTTVVTSDLVGEHGLSFEIESGQCPSPIKHKSMEA